MGHRSGGSSTVPPQPPALDAHVPPPHVPNPPALMSSPQMVPQGEASCPQVEDTSKEGAVPGALAEPRATDGEESWFSQQNRSQDSWRAGLTGSREDSSGFDPYAQVTA